MNDTHILLWYNKYGKDLFRYALSILHNREDAEDALQETFLKVMTCSSAPVAPRSVRPWLYRIVRNTCLDALRHQSREILCQDTPFPKDTPANSAELEFFHLIEGVKGTDRDILCLKIIGGLTHREIAGILDLTVHSTKKRYERTIHKLRLEYEMEAAL